MSTSETTHFPPHSQTPSPASDSRNNHFWNHWRDVVPSTFQHDHEDIVNKVIRIEERISSYEEDISTIFATSADDDYTLVEKCKKRVEEAVRTGDIFATAEWKKCLFRLDKLQSLRLDKADYLDHLMKGFDIKKTYPNARASMGQPMNISFAPRLWVVIIGINHYYLSKDDCLGGCVADALLVYDYMKNHLHVPEDHITLLVDPGQSPLPFPLCPTRNNIIDALYYLRDNPNILKGDIMHIYYSGHGTYYSASTAFNGCVGRIEAICPADRGTRTPDDDGHNIHDICDRELNVIFSEIADAKGPNIFVVADCCHSGSISRSPSYPWDLRTGRRVRWVRPLSGSGDLVAMLRAADSNPRRKESSRLVNCVDWQADDSSYVMIAACQDYQKAIEVDGNGVFTLRFIGALKSGSWSNRSYEEFVTQEMGSLGIQEPKVVGGRKGSKVWFLDEPVETATRGMTPVPSRSDGEGASTTLPLPFASATPSNSPPVGNATPSFPSASVRVHFAFQYVYPPDLPASSVLGPIRVRRQRWICGLVAPDTTVFLPFAEKLKCFCLDRLCRFICVFLRLLDVILYWCNACATTALSNFAKVVEYFCPGLVYFYRYIRSLLLAFIVATIVSESRLPRIIPIAAGTPEVFV